jgi:hypothetical protein
VVLPHFSIQQDRCQILNYWNLILISNPKAIFSSPRFVKNFCCFGGSRKALRRKTLSIYNVSPHTPSVKIQPPYIHFLHLRFKNKAFPHRPRRKFICLRGSCKSHLLRHSAESRNPESFENPGFRVALRLLGMTTSSVFESFARTSLGTPQA